MTAAVGPNGDRTEYAYYEAGDSIPGRGDRAHAGSSATRKSWRSRSRSSRTSARSPSRETGFSYDFSLGGSGVYTTTVKDARGNDSVYTLNIHGSPTRIQEPLGKETRDRLEAERHPEEPTSGTRSGVLTRYDYDARGNLTLERIEKAGAAARRDDLRTTTRSSTSSPTRRTPEGRETTHTIDSATGDLLATVDAVGNRTEFHYDGDGQLDRTKDPRGFTTMFRAFNDFGSPREIENPLGQLTTRSYDSRNRLIEERQEPYGRLARMVYDGYDRPVEQVRVSGGPASGDERTTTEYYPGGQPRAVTNPLGARTAYTLDGLNRVVQTAVTVGGETLTTETQYDGNGNADWEKDRRGVTRRKRLRRAQPAGQGRHRVRARCGEGPIGQIAAFGYDLAGNKTSETDLNGLVTGFDYDDLYHLERKILPVLKPGAAAHAVRGAVPPRQGWEPQARRPTRTAGSPRPSTTASTA